MARFFQPKQKHAPTAKHQLVRIERMDHQGAGIAYQGRKPIFIEGVLPGEQALVQVFESKSKYSRAKLIDLKSQVSSRQLPFCPHYHSCGGCNLQHLAHQDQIRYKQESLQQLMEKIAGQSVTLSPPISGEIQGYRRRARLSLKWEPGKKILALGFRQKQSNNIVNIFSCAVLDPVLNALLEPLRELFNGFSRPDRLGHIELIAADSGPVMLLRTLGKITDADRKPLEFFAMTYHISMYLMPEAGVIEPVAGEVPSYSETGIRTAFQPHHFIQVNRRVNQQMVRQALEWLQPGPEDRILDLFCGIGNFSLPIAKLAKFVAGVEGVEEMVEQARKNAAAHQLTNVRFYQANLEQNITENEWAAEEFDKILLDPARAGAKGIIDAIGQFGAKRVVYVSCDPSTLARDTQSLVLQGYQLERVGMLDMFPHTSHLESMALFVKAGRSQDRET